MTDLAKRNLLTPGQVELERRRVHENDLKRQQSAEPAAATVPAKVTATPPAAPSHRPPHEQILDEVAPVSTALSIIKFDGKAGKVENADGSEVFPETVFAAQCDRTEVNRIRFNGEGQLPTRIGGPLYGGPGLPPRESLGDTELIGTDEDPWKTELAVPLLQVDTGELFLFTTMSKTGLGAVGKLLRHFDRMEKSHPGHYPLVQLRAGGFNSAKYGWVHVPVLAVIGRVLRDSAPAPAPNKDEFNDSIPH
jgi:hypothetical protein